MELSNRLKTIASFVTKGLCVADIGTDHGYIPIDLVKSGKCPKAFAMDVGKEPLSRARQHIKEMDAQDQITCILSDGLNQLPQTEVDSLVIAGMGGDLVVKILENDLEKLKEIKEMILSPQSHLEKVRHFLHDHGFLIAKEAMVKEDGKYYVIIRAIHGKEIYEKECFYYFGEKLLKNQDPILLEYMDLQYQKYGEILKYLNDSEKEHIRQRREEILTMCDYIREAFGYYEM